MDEVSQQLKVKEGHARINYISLMAEQKALKMHRDKSKKAHKSGIVVIQIFECKKLVNTDTDEGKGGLSDPLVQLQVGDCVVRSKRKRNTLDPVYNEEFRLHWDGSCPLKIQVLDYDGPEQFEPMGDLHLELVKFDFGKLNEKTIKINDRKLQNVKSGTISLECKFVESKVRISRKESLMDARLTVLLNNSKRKFSELDKDNSGYIEGKELLELCKWTMEAYASDVKSGVKDQYVSELMAKIDADHDGKINIKEFSSVFQEAAGTIAVLRLSKRADLLHDWETSWSHEQHNHDVMIDSELQKYKQYMSELNADAAPFNESYDSVSRIECIRLQTTLRDLHKKLVSSNDWENTVKIHRDKMNVQRGHIEEEIANIQAEQKEWKSQVEQEDLVIQPYDSRRSSEKMGRGRSNSPPGPGRGVSTKYASTKH